MTTPFSIMIGNTIRGRRRALDLTQRELARRAGTSPAHLSRIESGYANPRLSTLDRLARALDTTFGGLFEDADDSPPTD